MRNLEGGATRSWRATPAGESEPVTSRRGHRPRPGVEHRHRRRRRSRPALRAGRSGIIADHELRHRPASRTVNAGEVRDFAAAAHRCAGSTRRRGGGPASSPPRRPGSPSTTPSSTSSAVAPDRVGVVIGTTSGESLVIEAARPRRSSRDGLRGDTRQNCCASCPPSRLAARGQRGARALTGESLTLATACSASNYAIGYAYDLIATGEADVMFAGGADSVCRWAHAGFFRLGRADRERVLAVRPRPVRDHHRRGRRGAACWRRSSTRGAAAPGSTPRCSATGSTATPSTWSRPDAASIAECMRLAHRNAGVEPSEVDYVCAHGTGTPANDSAEAQALRRGVRRRAAAGQLDQVDDRPHHGRGERRSARSPRSLAIDQGFLPPTINWAHPDPELAGLDPVPNRARAGATCGSCRTTGSPSAATTRSSCSGLFDGGVAVTGWGALCSAGVGVDALRRRLGCAAPTALATRAVRRRASCSTSRCRAERARPGRLQRPRPPRPQGYQLLRPVHRAGAWSRAATRSPTADSRSTTTTARPASASCSAPPRAASRRPATTAGRRWCRRSPTWSTRCSSRTP